MSKEKKAVAVPGEQLGVEEEYMPGAGVYLEEGKLYSSTVGALDIDTKNRRIGVRAGNRVAVPEVGDIVEGEVISPLKEDSAMIKIMAIRGKRNLTGTFTGILHVSQAAKSYVNTIYDVVNLATGSSQRWLPPGPPTSSPRLMTIWGQSTPPVRGVATNWC